MHLETVASERNLDHLKSRLVSLDPARLAGTTRLMRNKIVSARIRHAELIEQLHTLEKQYAEADNPHLQHHFMQYIEVLRPQIKHAFETISPYAVR
ncbi:hypothetical protein EOD10_07995 [Mesorhizobium sp. M7A.T.Ca.TU.009.01.3.2]|nr:hypothetical protein EOD10_07995 [Mesorhizobium sp. M7A.T.Ca.TU.009.01.3.2]RUV11374.1 hypothetical protein EOD00_09955 [Mesorhizobium sp. M7A.T.Ca.TU.009.01.3.1]